MTDTLRSLSGSELENVTGGTSARSAVLRKELHKKYGNIFMVGRTKFTEPPFSEGISEASGRFGMRGTGIPLVRSFTASVDAVRHKVSGLHTHVVAE